MFVHRYHLPYYQQVAVFFWPILFFELWRVDRWQDQTGRRAFVTPDRYGRAWVPWFEGMGQKPHLNGIDTVVYKPEDIDALCPGWLASVLTERPLAFLESDAPKDRADVMWCPEPTFDGVGIISSKPPDPG